MTLCKLVKWLKLEKVPNPTQYLEVLCQGALLLSTSPYLLTQRVSLQENKYQTVHVLMLSPLVAL